jgi:hypothetical protein
MSGLVGPGEPCGPVRPEWRTPTPVAEGGPHPAALAVDRALRRHRFVESDLHSAARENGFGSLDDVAAIILQADGTFAVISAEKMGDGASVRPFTSADG